MIPFKRIQAAANQIAERFKPEKIILFGSYAYGTPNENSDVDYMVLVRGTRTDQMELDIRTEIKFGFPVDVLVNSSRRFQKRIGMGDQFLIDINSAGKVLYEAADKGVGEKSRRRLRNSKARTARKKVA